MRTIILLAGVLAAATGCVAEPDAVDPTQTGGGGGKADDGQSSSGLAPTYALDLVSTTTVEDSRESDPAKRITTLTMRARAQVTTKQNGDAVTLAVKLCDVTLPAVSGYQPELDPAFIAGLPALQLVGSTASGRLSTEQAALVLGAQLANPVTDALPTSDSDSRVRDQDQDGHPGVSIRIPHWGSIYAALRVALSIKAPLASVDSITGTADVASAQAIYGDSIPFYDAAESAAETAAAVSVMSSTNTVKLERDAATCANVLASFP